MCARTRGIYNWIAVTIPESTTSLRGRVSLLKRTPRTHRYPRDRRLSRPLVEELPVEGYSRDAANSSGIHAPSQRTSRGRASLWKATVEPPQTRIHAPAQSTSRRRASLSKPTVRRHKPIWDPWAVSADLLRKS